MKKKLALVLAFIVIGLCLYTITGCGTGSSGGHTQQADGYALVEKRYEDVQLGGVAFVTPALGLYLVEAPGGSIPSGQHTVAVPHSETFTIPANNFEPATIAQYFYGNSPAVRDENIADPLQLSSSIAPYGTVLEADGDENGNYVFDIDGEDVTVAFPEAFPEPLEILAPNIIHPSTGFQISWNDDNPNNAYYVSVYVQDPATGDFSKKWTNVDSRGVNYNQPNILKDFIDDLPTGSVADVPAGIFADVETVIVEVSAYDKTEFSYTGTVPYGKIHVIRALSMIDNELAP